MMRVYKIIIFTNLILLGCIDLPAQTIVTFAGTGIEGSLLGDGGSALLANIPLPYGGCFDAIGNYYFGEDFGSPRIRKITPCGIITTVAGNGIPGFSGDSGLATVAEISDGYCKLDSLGNIYIPDYYNYRVRKVNVTTGIITTIAGNGTPTHTGDGGLAINATIVPGGLCVDKIGNIYIEDSARIRKIDTNGIITTIAGNGIGGYSGDGGLATEAEILATLDICVDKLGNLYFGCNGGVRIRKVDMGTGIITTIAGTGNYLFNGDGIHADSAQFKEYGMTFDANGNLFLADYGNQRIRMIDTFGIIHTVAGIGLSGFSGDEGPADSAKIYDPEGVAVDGLNNLYIADEANNRIRKVIFNPIITPTINITASSADTVCSGASISFNAVVTGDSIPAYQWLVNGNPVIDSSSTYTYIPADGDSIRCILSGNNLCNSISSNTIYIRVTPPPTIMLSLPTTALAGSTVTVTATVDNVGSSYIIEWYNNGVFFNTSTTPITTFTEAAGTDLITATVISASAGCYDSATSTAYTVTAITTGIANVTPHPVSIYPNPAHNELTITGTEITNVTVTNTIGQLLLTQDSYADKASINITSLPAGIYIVKVTAGNGEKTITEIVKE